MKIIRLLSLFAFGTILTTGCMPGMVLTSGEQPYDPVYYQPGDEFAENAGENEGYFDEDEASEMAETNPYAEEETPYSSSFSQYAGAFRPRVGLGMGWTIGSAYYNPYGMYGMGGAAYMGMYPSAYYSPFGFSGYGMNPYAGYYVPVYGVSQGSAGTSDPVRLYRGSGRTAGTPNPNATNPNYNTPNNSSSDREINSLWFRGSNGNPGSTYRRSSGSYSTPNTPTYRGGSGGGSYRSGGGAGGSRGRIR